MIISKFFHGNRRNCCQLTLSFIFLFCFLLLSCTTLNVTDQESKDGSASKQTWSERKTELSRYKRWAIVGAIAVINRKDKKKSFSAQASWTQAAGNYTIFLLGPINSANFRLTKTGGRVSLRFSDGKTFSAVSAESLLRQQAGLNLPVSNMYYWIRGLPAPGRGSRVKLDKQNRLQHLSQQGWSIHYLSYQRVGQLDLPRKITMKYPREQLKIKLAINKW